MNSSRVYERVIDEKSKANLILEEELNKMKAEKSMLEKRIQSEFEERVQEVKEELHIRLKKVTDELEQFQEKYSRSKAKKKALKEETERFKTESEKANNTLYNNIQSYEKRITELKEQFSKDTEDMKKREEEFMKSNEDLMDSDLYSVYKEIKSKFEGKLKECVEFKDQNNKIGKINTLILADENKIFKMNLDNSDNVLKECAKIQMTQQKVIKQLKEQLLEKGERLDKVSIFFISVTRGE